MRADRDLLIRVAAIGLHAAQRIMAFGFPETRSTAKADGSPVTQADLAAHRTILHYLGKAGWTVVSEEAETPASAPQGPYFLVDPLDGTREFIAGRPHYTVNLALIEAGRPTLGVIVVPAQAAIYLALNPRSPELPRAWRIRLERLERLGGLEQPEQLEQLERLEQSLADQPSTGDGHPTDNTGEQALERWCHALGNATWQRIYCAKVSAVHDPSTRAASSWRALASSSHLDARTLEWLAHHRVNATERFGSALKFCVLAEGGAEVYPRFAPTMEWDTAAGQAIVEAAGGSVCLPDGSTLSYGKPGWRNGDFIAWGRRNTG